MIFGKKEELSLYKGISTNIDKGIDFLLNFDDTQPEGRYEIDGDNVYALVTSGETKPVEEPVYEAHRKYIDLQYILNGEEDTGYASVSDCAVTVPYDENGDYLMVEGEGSEVRVTAGCFYIAFPCDAHRPMRSKKPGSIRKVIVKIAV